MKPLKQPTETEKILADKNLMQKIRKARKDGSPSSPYKPLSMKTLQQQLQERAEPMPLMMLPTDIILDVVSKWLEQKRKNELQWNRIMLFEELLEELKK